MINAVTKTGEQRRRRSLRVRLAVMGLLVGIAVVVSLAWVAFESYGEQTEVVARYPGYDAQRVPGSAKIYAQLRVGWFDSQKNFEIVVTDSEGRSVDGRTAVDDSDVLSFTPQRPLRAGTYDVEVHHRAPASAEDSLIDSWSITVEPAPDLADGSGGSVLLVAREGTRDRYLAEILRAEGITGFDAVTPEEITVDLLADHVVVILGALSSADPHLSDVESWVMGGGELITMKPQGALATMAGLEPTGEKIEDAYVEIDTTRPPGAGLTPGRIQFHGGALLYTSGPEVRTIASLSSDRELPGPHPAVTLAGVGASGGQIAAFSYDVATSILYTRQGQPASAGIERDGSAPIRPNDLFMGSGDERGFLDLSRIGIPQADEQMHLFSNILVELHGNTSPLPRFWYLPNGEKAALVMAADDHGTHDGTRQSFERMLSLSEPDCDVEQWECPRATSWLYPASLTAEEAEHYSELGFDLGVHVSTECADWTAASLHAAFVASMMEFHGMYPALPDQTGHRVHCVAYSDWLSLPSEESEWGIRLDMNFYNWPPNWIQHRPGYITGSALPMRFCDENGRMLNVFQQETHQSNETWMESTAGVEELIAAARDERGYYGAFGTHYDFSDDFDQELMNVAVRRDVPMVSAHQLLDFTEGREASGFTDVAQPGQGALTFNVDVDPRTDGMLRAMLPMNSGDRVLSSLTADGTRVDYDIKRIKGISYAFFEVNDFRYEAAYR